ncbi:MAG: hypothetical protein AAF561_03465 [Planctomycetota bacterium]
MKAFLTILALSAATASADVPIVESFDDAETPLGFEFVDINEKASGSGKTFGTGPGLNIADGKLVFFDNTNFGDVGVARVTLDGFGQLGFEMEAAIDVAAINFTQSKLGLFALAQGPASYDQNFIGLYAYVEELDTSGNSFRFVLGTGKDDSFEELDVTNEFDLTDGTPDFSIKLTAERDGDDVTVMARLIENEQDIVAPLTAELAAGDLPPGNQFGIRFNPGFNTLEVAVDDLYIGRSRED